MTDDRKFPLVGIGASAGGIPALEAFFRGVGDDDAMSYVVVTHLSPDRRSRLPDIVSRYTRLPVVATEDRQQVERGVVYVMPENAVLTIEGDRFRIRRPDPQTRERKPIDIFLASLGRAWGEAAIGIILSGGDADGTLGAKVIKEHGGLALAQGQDGSGPSNPDMPESAIHSGVIDLVIPAEEMGDKLRELRNHRPTLEPGNGRREAERTRQAQEDIYGILLAQTGHDFSGYKAKSFLRRVGRRMQLGQIASLEAYVTLLRSDPAEVSLLFRDLLINVTNFFRDEAAFEALARIVVPRLFENRDAGDTIRIWVPGCATGEEVYSIAILLREHMETLSAQPRVQIFATDIDEAALGVARAGRYPQDLLEGVSQDRKQRFFTNDGGTYVVGKHVRELCIFSPHSVIRDPPFSRMDMVSCRNLLIYFSAELQRHILPTFHYALKPGGYLFLGTSEGVSQHTELFATLDKKNRIFQSRAHGGPAPHLRATLATAGHGSRTSDPHTANSAFPLRQTVEAHVIERFAPPHVLVNAEGEVVYYSARTGRFLEAPAGTPSRQLSALARKGLRIELRAALREAMETGRPVVRENIAVDEGDDLVQPVDVTVEPVREHQEPLYLVLFSPRGPLQRRSEAVPERVEGDSMVQELERELRDTRERLQSTIEEYETSMEELKSANEELVSVNEEAQSTNEELEASKEEMQSLNEELNTINAELAAKVEELDRANSDLKNLFDSTQIATVFLDHNLVIRNYTPAASSFFRLLPSDIGRPLTDLASHLDYPELSDHSRQVAAAGDMIEHRIFREADGRHFLVRLLPYRDAAGRTRGVVVTFIDVTNLAEAEEHQRVLVDELNHRVKNMLAVVIGLTQQTLAGPESRQELTDTLVGRLHAMARAYGTLSRENWRPVSVEKLLRQELEPFGESVIAIEGEPIEVSPQIGLSIGMVIHELATNALKYGALSTPRGRVTVTWGRAAGGGRLRFDWTERNGPKAPPPGNEGFGLRLIRGEVEYRLGGKVEPRFGDDGLEFRLEFPLPA